VNVKWDVRVDASADPVDTVEASGWFEARALAAEKLGINFKRLHVSQSVRAEKEDSHLWYHPLRCSHYLWYRPRSYLDRGAGRNSPGADTGSGGASSSCLGGSYLSPSHRGGSQNNNSRTICSKDLYLRHARPYKKREGR
jgi:hypothetical protein